MSDVALILTCAVCFFAYLGALAALARRWVNPDDALVLGLVAACGFTLIFVQACRG